GRSTPFGDEFVLVFETAGEYETATNPVASLVSRRQRPVVIATHALVTTGEEAQRCRHTGESVAGDAPSLQTPQEPMPFLHRIQSPGAQVESDEIDIRKHPRLGALQVHQQAVTSGGVHRVVADGALEAQTRNQQSTAPRIRTQGVALLFQAKAYAAIPAVGQTSLEQCTQHHALTVGIVDVFPLPAGEESQVTGLRRRKRNLIPARDFLSRLRQLHLRSPAVATGIEPMLCPLGSGTGAHVGGKAPAETQRMAFAGVQ